MTAGPGSWSWASRERGRARRPSASRRTTSSPTSLPGTAFRGPAAGTELGQKVKGYIDRGELPPEVVVGDDQEPTGRGRRHTAGSSWTASPAPLARRGPGRQARPGALDVVLDLVADSEVLLRLAAGGCASTAVPTTRHRPAAIPGCATSAAARWPSAMTTPRRPSAAARDLRAPDRALIEWYRDRGHLARCRRRGDGDGGRAVSWPPWARLGEALSRERQPHAPPPRPRVAKARLLASREPMRRRPTRWTRCARPAGWWPRCTKPPGPDSPASPRPARRGGPRGAGQAGRPVQLLGYHGFPAVICTSPNDMIVHGIPGRTSWPRATSSRIDCGAIIEGYHGDAAYTVAVGEPGQGRKADRGHRGALGRHRPAGRGNRLHEVGRAVQKVAEAAGFSVVREYVGHAIGTAMHEEPQVPNYWPARPGPTLKDRDGVRRRADGQRRRGRRPSCSRTAGAW